jgi:hypothetical protein
LSVKVNKHFFYNDYPRADRRIWSAGDEGDEGDEEDGEGGITINAQCPIPNAQCPIPNAPFPIFL